ncbi:1-acyl-sn-glycerol-3-phosphate acyltransferase [Lentibacillus amyloliquefaciens]|uniref:Phospholipid/glycerol acyltransferase domain-containing protein n=1 Tax=Lentibacillus amyloliquefaciens TaxID=1472767 RepID=A0A0U4E8H2_9BACI|nr:1-acyl-sn-glycerol-3-phosphate acyltransferase [Lentibacillus amyloliquefaciens]ALX49580.1 hypothetical protein AOX59_14000 [Lentibacillus amyloliquefaciens]
MSIERKPGKTVERLLRTPIKAFIEHRSDIVIERNDTKDMEGPYIILSNHVNNWDPLLLNCYVDEPISFIAADPLFRNPFLKRILNYVGAIPKQKFKNDTRTIRLILKAKKHNRVIGIFPEGNRNWDGKTDPLIYSTSKLVKLLDIPVVIATIRGGHLSHPRWGDGHRKGTIAISFEKVWDAGAFHQNSPEEVHERLTEALYHDEMAWQSEHMVPYKRKSPAHYLERLLFICPHCHVPGSLHSYDDLFECQHCGYTVHYTDFGTFEPIGEEIYYSTPRDWNKWQLDFLKSAMTDPEWQALGRKVMQDHVKLYVSNDEAPFKLVSAGNLWWVSKQVKFQSDMGNDYEFPINEMVGLNIQFHHKLDFYHNHKLFRIVFYLPRTSAYKWLKVIQTRQALDAGKVDIT